jgi:hypothetical protein
MYRRWSSVALFLLENGNGNGRLENKICARIDNASCCARGAARVTSGNVAKFTYSLGNWVNVRISDVEMVRGIKTKAQQSSGKNGNNFNSHGIIVIRD